MLGKNHAKLFYDIMNKLFQTFQSPYSLHKPPHPYCFTLPSSHEFCGQIFENIFFSLDLLVQKLFFDKNHWFQLLSTKNDWLVSLFLISITLHSLSVNHSIMSSVGEEALAFDENFIATPHQVTLREKILFLGVLSVFLFFFFRFCFLSYWDHYEQVYMRTKVNSNQFQISNRFEMSFCLHGSLHGNLPNNSKTLLHMCKWCLLINAKQMLRYWLFSKQ